MDGWSQRMRGGLRVLGACGVALVLGLQNGCSTMSMGDTWNSELGSPTYGRGELRSVESASMSTTWKATLGSVRELGYAVERQEKASRTSRLDVLGAGGRNIQITLNRYALGKTEICVRVSPSGDEAIARLILAKIQQRL